MAVKNFAFTKFSRPLWKATHISKGENTRDIVLDVSEGAPPEAERASLKTTVRTEPSPNAYFNSYIAIHDVFSKVRDVYPSEGSQVENVTNPRLMDEPEIFPDPDELVTRCYTRPRKFSIFEISASPGHIYTTMAQRQIREMVRRAGNMGGGDVARLEPRSVNLLNLENEAKKAGETTIVIHGYDLENVSWSTPVSRLGIEANETTGNVEAQNAKTRAEIMRVLKIYVQAPRQMVSVRVAANGSVQFPIYPEDDVAMNVLALLDPMITRCLQTQ